MQIIMKENIIAQLQRLPGKIAFYYKDLLTGETIVHQENEALYAASVIKLFIMVEAFRRFDEGTLDPKQKIAVRSEHKVPSCGALTYLHDGLEASLLDLVTLMIILSDNTATNILIDVLGMDTINQQIRNSGCRQTILKRKMFDREKAARGFNNVITAAETGDLLERLYFKELISPSASEQMLSILHNQRLNSKLPFFLKAMDPAPEIAHKTGEDAGITHDVGIVFPTKGNPFIVCFLGNETDVCRYERLMADLTLELYSAGKEGTQ